MQVGFNPIDFCFKWTEASDSLNPNDLGWYEWDRKKAHSEALKARNARAKQLKKDGYTVTTFTLSNQLVTRGGIGSGHPQIEAIVNCYYLNAEKR